MRLATLSGSLFLLGGVAMLGCSDQRIDASKAIAATPASSTDQSSEPASDAPQYVPKTDAEYRKILTPEQFNVTRQQGTERAFTGKYWDEKTPGMYHCVCCGLPLFDSETKYKSGTGWPSYWAPVNKENVALREDNSLWGSRTEVVCSRCDAHLGHVFDDGPQPTGLRYCLNSAALKLEPREAATDKPQQ